MKVPNIKAALAELIRLANQYGKQAEFQLRSLKKCKEAIKSKFRPYRINPRRFGYTDADKVPKQFRKRVRGAQQKVHTEFNNLLLQKTVVNNSRTEAHRLAGIVVSNLADLQELLQSLPTQVQAVEQRAKSYSYERRNEIALYNEILGRKSPPRTKRKLDSKGEAKMARKQKKVKKGDKASIKQLLGKLEKASDPQAKRELRVQLRALGHKGGLGKGPGRPKKVVKKKKKAAAKK